MNPDVLDNFLLTIIMNKRKNIFNINDKEIENEKLISLDNLLMKGEFKKVISNANKYIMEYPEQVFFYTILSIAYSQLGETQKALDILKNAEKNFSDNYELLFQMGKIYEDLADYESAVKYYYRSLEATPESYKEARADCLNDIGALKYNLGSEEEAIELWNKALKIDPAHEKAKYNLRQMQNETDEENSIYSLQEEYNEFEFIQKYKYLDEKDKRKFTSKKEQEVFTKHVEAVWFKKIFLKIDKLEQMSEEERTEWYEDIEIDFTKPVPMIAIPQIEKKLSKELNKIFSFLPENGMVVSMAASPALDYVGLTEKKIKSFVTKQDVPDEREKHLLKWAYDIGSIIIELAQTINKKKKNELFDKLVETVRTKLDENDTEIVLDKIIKQATK